MYILMGKSLAVFRKSYLLIHNFLGSNAKIDFFEEKMGLTVVLSNLNAGSNKLVQPTSKNTKHLKF